MTKTTPKKPIPDTRYAKQGAPQGDFAVGERTKPPVPEIDDFASGEHTLPPSTAVEDFASGEHMLPATPEEPALMDTLPAIAVVPDKKRIMLAEARVTVRHSRTIRVQSSSTTIRSNSHGR